MLKTIHKYQKSILSLLVMLIVSLAMLGFGVDFFVPSRERHAITVADRKVTFTEFYRELNNLREAYRSQFGDLYYTLVQNPGWNPTQMVLDSLVPSLILQEFAAAIGLTAGKEEVTAALRENIPAGASDAMVAALLQQLRMSPAEFRERISNEVVVQQVQLLLESAARPSVTEAARLWTMDKTRYSVNYTLFDPAVFAQKLPSPTVAELEEYFHENPSRYEVPPRAAYDFVVFKPADYADLVEITADDLELFYVDNETRFTEPARAKIRAVRWAIPANAKDAEKERLREQAQQLRNEVLAGGDFASLARSAGDHPQWQEQAGELGWLQAGDEPAALSRAALTAADSSSVEFLETPEAFYVYRIEDIQAQRLKELAEVKDEITAELTITEAPSYASIKAYEFLEDWQASGLPLGDYAAQVNKSKLATDGLVTEREEPFGAPAGLTRKIFEDLSESARVIDAGQDTVVAIVTAVRETEIPPLAEVQPKVEQDFQAEAARREARLAAEDMLARLQSETELSLAAAVKEAQVKLETKSDLQPAAMREEPLNNSAIQRLVFGTPSGSQSQPELFAIDDKVYILQVTQVTEPDATGFAEDKKRYLELARQANLKLMLDSLIAGLRRQYDVKIDGGLLVADL